MTQKVQIWVFPVAKAACPVLSLGRMEAVWVRRLGVCPVISDRHTGPVIVDNTENLSNV